MTSGLMPGGVGGMGGSGGASLLPPVMQRKASHSSLYPSLAQPQQHHPHFSDLVGVESGQGVGGVVGGPEQTQEHSYLDMDSYPNNAGEKERLISPH